MKKFSDVTVVFDNKFFALSKFKKGQKKISKAEYKSYCYNWAINFGLFYIGFSKKIIYKGFNLDLNSNLGLIRFIKKGKKRNKKQNLIENIMY